MNQYERLCAAYKAMTDQLGEFPDGHLIELIYYRNIQEYNESPTPDCAKCMFSYMSEQHLMQSGIIPLRVTEFPNIERYAWMEFYWNRTIVTTYVIEIDPRRRKSNFYQKTATVVLDVREQYEGFMHSNDVRKLIKSKNLQTFLKLGDENEHENVQLWNI